MFSANATTPAAPEGLLFNVTPITAVPGGGQAAMIKDIFTLDGG
jgi:hypothetical protein